MKINTFSLPSLGDNSNKGILFNHKDIERIYFLGFQDKEELDYVLYKIGQNSQVIRQRLKAQSKDETPREFQNGGMERFGVFCGVMTVVLYFMITFSAFIREYVAVMKMNKVSIILLVIVLFLEIKFI